MKRKAGSPGSSSVNSFSLYDSPHLSIPNDRPSKAARSVHNSPSPDQESVFMPFATSAADFSQNPSYHNMLSSPSINSSDLVNKFLPSGLEDWMPPTSLGDMEPMFKQEGHQNFFQQPHILSVGGGMGWRSHKRYASDSVIWLFSPHFCAWLHLLSTLLTLALIVSLCKTLSTSFTMIMLLGFVIDTQLDTRRPISVFRSHGSLNDNNASGWRLVILARPLMCL